MPRRPGFLEHDRELPEPRPVEERLRDWREVLPPQEEQQTRRQACRCMTCGVPFCHQGCPLGNLIPDFNQLVAQGRWREAYLRLAATNDLPEVTGRICPAPCEAACVLAINRPPVTIEQIEKEIIERAFAEGWVTPRPPSRRTGRRVAVVGSGPAGLAAAALLNRAGHHVTVYEAADAVGGLLRYGVPDFKLEKWVIDRRVALMRAEGIAFQTGCEVGQRVSWTRLHDTNDAVLVATGAQRPRDLRVPGRELEGVYFAMDFLLGQNRAVAHAAAEGAPRAPDQPPPGPAIDAAGARVVILGGGDTGSDCLGTALRQGAASVRQIELLPRPPERRAPGNAWPEWPLVYRSSSSHAEGGTRDFALMTRRLEGQAGRLTGLRAVRVEQVQAPGGGSELRELSDSELVIEADLLILALGFEGAQVEQLRQQLGVELDRHNTVKTDGQLRTTVDGVFAAGDAKRGASLVVWALAEGRQAARAIDAFLTGDQPRDTPYSSSASSHSTSR